VAFLPDDGVAVPEWLEARLKVHRRGFDAVGGSITNGTPRSAVGTAGYLLEYSALLPVRSLLEQQEIPHALSFKRTVFDRVGLYSEDTRTGEDTLFNQRCIRAGISLAFAPDAAIEHRNLMSLGGFLAHAANHGRGLVQCVTQHRLGSVIGPPEQAWPKAAARMFLLYPAHGWLAKLKRLRQFAPELLPTFLQLSPLVVLGLLATGKGAWDEWLSARSARAMAQPGTARKQRRWAKYWLGC
jgi:GT2 family glycosyltransferase